MHPVKEQLEKKYEFKFEMVKYMEKTKDKSLHQPLTEKADSLGAHTDELSAGSSC